MTNTLPDLSANVDEVRTEATIVLRTVEHIAFDLDYFSRTIRIKHNNATVIEDIERHLGQARRNCADATAIAEEIVKRHGSIDDVTNTELDAQANQLRDAFALLALADAAYLRAFEIASPR